MQLSKKIIFSILLCMSAVSYGENAPPIVPTQSPPIANAPTQKPPVPAAAPAKPANQSNNKAATTPPPSEDSMIKEETTPPKMEGPIPANQIPPALSTSH